MPPAHRLPCSTRALEGSGLLAVGGAQLMDVLQDRPEVCTVARP